MQISHADGTTHPHDQNGNPVQPPTNDAPKADDQSAVATETVQLTTPAETQSFPLAGVVIGGVILVVLVAVVSLYATRHRAKRPPRK